MYTDNEFKFVAVLNKKIELPRLLNALGHMTAGLVSLCENTQSMRFLEYRDADGGFHPGISFYPFIILSAKNGNQIRTLRAAAIGEGILCTDFVDTMLGSSAQDQMDKTRSTKEELLDYYGVCLFGSAAKLNDLTKKFSLFSV
ncbi:MAG: DUF2000 domain-containing protein [Anaerolineae bacterium]|nr:MAG: DUF2000 domain-containing protein [Anaerolineae bacterium]